MPNIFSPTYKLAILLLLIFACALGNQKVVVVYGGDTFELKSGEWTRILGINIPEIGENGADIARDFLEKFLIGKAGRLEKDSKNRYKYECLLMHVYVDDFLKNLVKELMSLRVWESEK